MTWPCICTSTHTKGNLAKSYDWALVYSCSYIVVADADFVVDK